MLLTRTRGIAIALVLLASLAAAQITFSRDWTGGKRSAPEPPVDCAQFAHMCRHVVHELKRSLRAELAAIKKRPDHDSTYNYHDD